MAGDKHDASPSSSSILYIEPKHQPSDPLLDELTRKMTAAFRLGESNGAYWRGIHLCICGAYSDNTDYILPSGHQTNYLAVHYVALHRDEIPEDQLAIVDSFEVEPEMPTAQELGKLIVPKLLESQSVRIHQSSYTLPSEINGILVGFSDAPPT